MTDITRLLENPVVGTTIVQKVVLLLVEHVVCKKKKEKRLMRPLLSQSQAWINAE
jgi:hypothetical protein